MADPRVPSTDAELLALVREVSLRDFGMDFLHACRFNPRLRTVGGRYLLGSHNLEFNPRHAAVHGLSELLGAIRHELCHYHLHMANRGYRHGDIEFRELLRRVGGARYARPLRTPGAERVVEYFCSTCGTKYRRRRRIDLTRYVCGRCRGALRPIEGTVQPACAQRTLAQD